MKSLSTYLIVAIVLLLGLAGYYYLDQVAPLQASVAELERENKELLFQLEQLKSQNAELAQQLEEKVEELSKEKEEEVARLKSTYEDLVSNLQQEVEKGEITITRLADQLKVNIVDRIIFPSGTADITPEGENVLTQVGNILKENKDKRIRVEGHTDNVPIHPNLQDRYATNWELSVARATNVVRFLEQKVGIDPKLLEATGYGEHQPIATNETAKGRAQNRRIEIVLLPKDPEIPEISKK